VQAVVVSTLAGEPNGFGICQWLFPRMPTAAPRSFISALNDIGIFLQIDMLRL